MKVKDLAKELNQSVFDLIKFLADMGIRVKGPSAKLDPKTVSEVKELFKDQAIPLEEESKQKEVFTLTSSTISVGDLSKRLKVPISDVLKKALEKGLLVNLNSELDKTIAIEIAEALDFDVLVDENSDIEEKEADIKEAIKNIDISDQKKDPSKLSERPPVITIMGHVDHGKTLLLDTIRKANVIDTESGGITQHIGAYQIDLDGKKLTFLDTPGHAAFTALRARGAQVTDIVILVVACDEGIKPQTVEAIHHAKDAGVPILVALNKSDKPTANIDMCKQQLSEHDLLAEDWGGQIVMLPVSAKENKGIKELLEMILLTSEVLELKTDTKGDSKSVIIESRLSRKKGAIATVLVKSGTLKIGDSFVLEHSIGKVRSLINDQGQTVSEALPGMPVEVLGISEVPKPGSIMEVMPLSKAKASVQAAPIKRKETSITLEALSRKIGEGELVTLNVILKTDVNGSLDGLQNAIKQIDQTKFQINVVHAATGAVVENDIMLAVASQAIIFCFNVPIQPEAEKLAKEESITLRSYDIIYELIDDIQKTVEGLFEPEYEEVEIGRAEIRKLYHFSKIGNIAGSYVLTGKFIRNAVVGILRDGEEVDKAKLTTLKRFKDDVKEVASGFECGIVLDKNDALKEGDQLICYETRKK